MHNTIGQYLDDKEYAVRYWPIVPPVGDKIVLEDGKGTPFLVTVKSVEWGSSESSMKFPCKQLDVTIDCVRSVYEIERRETEND